MKNQLERQNLHGNWDCRVVYRDEVFKESGSCFGVLITRIMHIGGA